MVGNNSHLLQYDIQNCIWHFKHVHIIQFIEICLLISLYIITYHLCMMTCTKIGGNVTGVLKDINNQQTYHTPTSLRVFIVPRRAWNINIHPGVKCVCLFWALGVLKHVNKNYAFLLSPPPPPVQRCGVLKYANTKDMHISDRPSLSEWSGEWIWILLLYPKSQDTISIFLMNLYCGFDSSVNTKYIVFPHSIKSCSNDDLGAN